MLGQMLGFRSLLELPLTPTIDDLKRLIAICSNLPQSKLPKDKNYETQSLSDEAVAEIASNLIGRLCVALGFHVPKNLSSDTSMLCRALHTLYTIVDERTTRRPIMLNRQPAPSHEQLTQEADTSSSLLSYEVGCTQS